MIALNASSIGKRVLLLGLLVVSACLLTGTPAYGQAATAPATSTAAAKKTIQGAQERLLALGYQPGAADGVMGAKAITALKKFQSDHSLPATGLLDRTTLDALGASHMPELAQRKILSKTTRGVSTKKEPVPPVQSLLDAILKNDTEVVRDLLDKGVDASSKSSNGAAMLSIASTNGYAAITQLLLERGANVNAKDSDGMTALMGASQNGNIEIAQLLLGHSADINVAADNGMTALMHAAKNGRYEMMKLLLQHGADVNAQSQPVAPNEPDHGTTAMIMGNDGKWQTFSSHTVVAHEPGSWTALLLAANLAQQDLKQAYQSGDDSQERTLEVVRQDHDRLKFVQLLIDSGADVNAKNSDGWTTLMFLMHGGTTRFTYVVPVSRVRYELIQQLVAKGADVDAKNVGGGSVWSISQQTGYTDLIPALKK
jgi:ankyrin repeat protein